MSPVPPQVNAIPGREIKDGEVPFDDRHHSSSLGVLLEPESNDRLGGHDFVALGINGRGTDVERQIFAIDGLEDNCRGLTSSVVQELERILGEFFR